MREPSGGSGLQSPTQSVCAMANCRSHPVVHPNKTKIANSVRPEWGREPGLQKNGAGPHLCHSIRSFGNRRKSPVAWDGGIMFYLEFSTNQCEPFSTICVTMLQLLSQAFRMMRNCKHEPRTYRRLPDKPGTNYTGHEKSHTQSHRGAPVRVHRPPTSDQSL